MNSIGRKLRICFVSATPEMLLNVLTDSGIVLLDLQCVDLLTTQIVIHNHQRVLTLDRLNKYRADIKSINQVGLLWLPLKLFKRPVAICGIVLFLLVSVFTSGRILLVRVSGNQSIPSNLILAEAESCGIGFGQKAKVVRSEEVKNQLLAKLPELQWLGITTSGCIANINVQERIQPEVNQESPNVISNVVAARDGTITEMTVDRGTALVSTGQAVKKGDILISGYSDLGRKLLVQNAQGEVMAYTTRKCTVVIPVPTYYRDVTIRKHRCFRLRIGKKAINFCNHSGIPEVVCVKMYSEDCWNLPGGFCLPVSLAQIDCWHYSVTEQSGRSNDVTSWLPLYAKRYLQSQMVSGQIMKEELVWLCADGYTQLDGLYACHEMIGKVKYEEITQYNAEDY